MLQTEVLTLTIDGRDVDVLVDRPFRLSCRVAGAVVVAEALSMDEARERFEQQYRDTRNMIDTTTAADVYPRGCYPGD
jgi:hypothetical protein